MEEKDDWTCGREGDRPPFTEINLQDEFVTPINLVLNYSHVTPLVCYFTFDPDQKWFFVNDHVNSIEKQFRIKIEIAGQRRHYTWVYQLSLGQKLDPRLVVKWPVNLDPLSKIYWEENHL